MGWFGKKFKCEACGAKFKSEAELADHAKTHKTAAAGSIRARPAWKSLRAMENCRIT